MINILDPQKYFPQMPEVILNDASKQRACRWHSTTRKSSPHALT